MANPQRGEADFTVDGRVYTLRPGFNACCALEPLINGSFQEALKMIEQGRLSGLRAVIWVMLWKYHRSEIKTLEDAGDWIERAGGWDPVMDIVYKVLALNVDEAIEGSGKANPPETQVGTTAPVLSVPGASA